MSSTFIKNTDAPEPSEEQVANYLLKHPEFLIDRPALLAAMELPHHSGGGTISLVERQVAILRERNMTMRHRLSELLDNARRNDMLFGKTRQLLLDMLGSDSLESLLGNLLSHFDKAFAIHFTRLLLITETERSSAMNNKRIQTITQQQLQDKAINTLISHNKPICGQLAASEVNDLFDKQAGQIGSVAIVPLRYKTLQLGVLAIANRDANYYRSSTDTLFLHHIGEVLSQRLNSYRPFT
ncbi:MAG: DUF484 family protein [Cellvibrionaceae bacterium]|nr:DUF484 family protein [Cellvibrionaceae bacterium]